MSASGRANVPGLVEKRRVRRRGLAAGIVAAAFGGGFLSPSHAQEPENSALRYERAQAFARSGAAEAALIEFDALLAEFPNDADYLLGRAQMQARLGQDAGAVATAEHALRLAPDYEDVWQLRLKLADLRPPAPPP